MTQRRSISVPVEGGELSVEVAGPMPSQRSPVVLFFHDLASNAVVWRLVTSRLDETATSLSIEARGRAASAEVSEPYGVARHVADAVAVLDYFESTHGASSSNEPTRCVVVGHGTGAWAAMHVAAAMPDRVLGAVLVDGGMPLEVSGDPRQAIDAALLPVLRQLRIVYADRDAALLSARRTGIPGLAQHVFDDVVLHDLCGAPPRVRRRTNEAAVWFDGSELLLDPSISRVIERLDLPIEMLRVEPEPAGFEARALAAGPCVGTGSLAAANDLERRLDHLCVVTVPGLDHDGLVMHPQGADAVVRSILRVITRSALR